MKRALVFIAMIFVTRLSVAQAATLVVHEWGTITTQHLADGTPMGRLNRIAPSEVLPAFVHRFEPSVTQSTPERRLTKSPATPGRPDVTMRLETPVIYFYPSAQWNRSITFNVDVIFRGGVMNEFYPNATTTVAVDVDRIAAKQANRVIRNWDGVNLDNFTLSTLQWRNLRLNDAAPLPLTDQHIWLSPRKVQATTVATKSESEKYLFYRGVAHLDALMQTTVSAKEVILRAPSTLYWMPKPSMTITKTWLLDVKKDGAIAMRAHDRATILKSGESQPLIKLVRFQTSDYSAANYIALRASLRQELIAAGLFAAEADAMLETWRDSYFKQPGLRILYLVPLDWIEHFLPLTISAPNTLTRVLVGRIDLVTPAPQ